MPRINVQKLSVAALKDLVARAEKAIERKQRQEEQAFLKEMRTKARQRGLDFDSMVSKPTSSGATRKARKLKAKYKDPASGKTWSGVGRAPKWIAPYLKNEKKLQEFRV